MLIYTISLSIVGSFKYNLYIVFVSNSFSILTKPSKNSPVLYRQVDELEHFFVLTLDIYQLKI